MRALVTGATGFVGRHLVQRLGAGAAAAGRDAQKCRTILGEQVECVTWNPAAEPAPADALRGRDAVFHLAGESVGEGRWSAEKKARILESRVAGTRNLVAGIAALPEGERPKVLVSASAIGYYGDRGDEVLEETSAPAADFLAEVCRAWEAEAERARDLGVRVVAARIGVVLGAGGGALPRMLTPFRLGVGGRIGSGRQWMAWVHLEDAGSLLLLAAERADLSGPMNVVAPRPVTNLEFTKTLASVLGRPAILPVPKLALRIAVGEFANFLTMSQRVVPRAAQAAGYAFRFPELRGALEDILQGA